MCVQCTFIVLRIDCLVSAYDERFCLNVVRFDIRGLSPGSSEDEAGIKEASELCKIRVHIFYCLSMP